MAKTSPIAARDIFRGRFFLNLAIVLAATSWIPMVSMKVADPDGGAVREHLVPVYRCYQALFVQPSLIAVVAVALHVTICAVISYAVQRLVLRAQAEP